ncbi:MAG: sulfotransferase family protein [Acidimicrobiia bacterium]
MTTRIHLISGPRNISTALMYSFRSRADTTVFDEPLYGHYLRVTGVEHPGREEILASVETNGETAIREIILGPCPTPVVFLKSMGHHTLGLGLDLSFLDDVTNVFLIREPEEMLTSLIKNLPEATPDMTGLPQQVELLDRIVAAGGDPVVLDSGEVLRAPEAVLRGLCERVGIVWDPAMLSWSRGAKPEDGVWAPTWYRRLHDTTGFEPHRPNDETVPDHLLDVLEECRAHYRRLAPLAIRAGD